LHRFKDLHDRILDNWDKGARIIDRYDKDLRKIDNDDRGAGIIDKKWVEQYSTSVTREQDD